MKDTEPTDVMTVLVTTPGTATSAELPAAEILISGIADIALQIAKERAAVLAQLKEALLRDDDVAIKKFARLLCGI